MSAISDKIYYNNYVNYSFLSTFGLTDKEISLYELLLAHGRMGAGDIIKQSKLKRATVYQSLYSLEKKGLISHYEAQKKIHFKIESPTKVLELANTQLRNFEQSQRQLMSVLSSLNSQYVLAVEKPVVAMFEGVEGLKEIYNDMLSVGKPIYAALTPEPVEPTLYKWLTSLFVKKRAKLGIEAQVLVAESEKSAEYIAKNKEELRNTKIVDKSKYPFQHEVDIYGDKVAFINYRKGEHLLGIVIHHPSIAKTMKALFDMAWDGVKN